jgi:hypothetical protein
MQLRRKINGDRWKIKIVNSEEMSSHREDGEHLAALCIPSEKIILIEENNIDLQTITHELVHAHFSYLYLDDTNNIKLDDFEEIMCTFFASKGDEIIAKGKKLTKDLLKLKERNE